MSSDFSQRLADWTHDGDALRTIRRTVFVVEQGVPEALEWDAVDPLCATGHASRAVEGLVEVDPAAALADLRM